MATPRIISFRLPPEIAISCDDPEFWRTVNKHGVEVDHLEGYDHAMVGVLADWLASERRILMLQPTRVEGSPHVLALGHFDRHALSVLRTRLRKAWRQQRSQFSTLTDLLRRDSLKLKTGRGACRDRASIWHQLMEHY